MYQFGKTGIDRQSLRGIARVLYSGQQALLAGLKEEETKLDQASLVEFRLYLQRALGTVSFLRRVMCFNETLGRKLRERW